MSERTGTGGGLILGGVAVLGLLALVGMGGSEPEQCDKPAPQSCYTVATTLVPPIGGDVDNTTALPTEGDGDTVPATVVLPAPSTAKPVEDTTLASGKPNSEAAPKPTDPPATEPPATEPPATSPPPQGVDVTKCERTATVRSGDTWVSIADRGDVWTRDLLALNQATKETPLYVGVRVCLPPSVYGPGTTAPAATTVAPDAPTVPVATTVAPTAPLAPQAPPTTTTQARTSPNGTRATVPPTAPPTTADQRKLAPLPPKQPQAPPVVPTTVFRGGAVRPTTPSPVI